MDRLDRISIFFIVVLVASLIVIVEREYKSVSENSIIYSSVRNRNPTNVSEIPPEKIKMLKDLIATNNIKKAEALLGDLLREFPYEGEVHMLMGDIMMRKQDPVMAIYSYKEAIDLNPDYVDRKTSLFQGYKIKNAVDEAMDIINNALMKNPGNKDMKKAKKTVYYLLRRLAGSCG
jgi:tetratricopeptide (TPR) repeat protein